MKKSLHLGLIAVILSALAGCSELGGGDSEEPLRIAFISHTYYVNRHPDLQQMIVDEINAADVEYVFALGDIVLMNRDEYWKGSLDFFSKMNAEVYYSPGNHDIFNFDIVEGLGTDRHYPKWRQEYIDRIGYVNTMVQDPRADFILINSNDPFPLTQPFLDEALEKADPDTPTLLLTHHRIWLERYQDVWVHWYFKSTRKEEMMPYIPKFDQVVIGDLWGHLEHKTIADTPVKMIGMGNNDKPAFWVFAELKDNGKFAFEQRTIDLPEGHPYIHVKNK